MFFETGMPCCCRQVSSLRPLQLHGIPLLWTWILYCANFEKALFVEDLIVCTVKYFPSFLWLMDGHEGIKGTLCRRMQRLMVSSCPLTERIFIFCNAISQRRVKGLSLQHQHDLRGKSIFQLMRKVFIIRKWELARFGTHATFGLLLLNLCASNLRNWILPKICRCRFKSVSFIV